MAAIRYPAMMRTKNVVVIVVSNAYEAMGQSNLSDAGRVAVTECRGDFPELVLRPDIGSCAHARATSSPRLLPLHGCMKFWLPASGRPHKRWGDSKYVCIAAASLCFPLPRQLLAV